MKQTKAMNLVPFLFALCATSSTLTQAQPFTPISESQVPSGIDYQLTQPEVQNPNLFAGKRVAILASHGVEESEITYPYEFLSQRGAVVDLLVPSWTPEGITVSRFLKPTLWAKATGTFADGYSTKYDLLVLTGGAWNAQVVRTDNDALRLIQKHYFGGNPLASICASPVILINAGIVKRGMNITSSPSVKIDMMNAGGVYQDQPTVFSGKNGNLLTSRSPEDLPHFVMGIQTLLLKSK